MNLIMGRCIVRVIHLSICPFLFESRKTGGKDGNMKRLTAMLLLLVLVLSLGACGIPKPAEGNLVEQTARNMKNLDSMGMIINLSCTAGVEGLSLPAELNMKCETILEPFQFHLDAKVGMMGMGFPLAFYVNQEEPMTVIALGMDMGQGMEWETGLEEIPPLGELNDLSELLPVLAAMAGEPAQEKMEGRKVYTYRVKLDRETLERMLDGELPEGAEPMFQALLEQMPQDASLPLSFSIDPEEKLLRGLALDLSQMMEGLAVDAMGAEVSDVVLTISYDDFNQISEIRIPAEAFAS